MSENRNKSSETGQKILTGNRKKKQLTEKKLKSGIRKKSSELLRHPGEGSATIKTLRKCSKPAPLPPLNMGIKSKQKQTKPQSSKKMRKPRRKVTLNVKRKPRQNKSLKNKRTAARKISKPEVTKARGVEGEEVGWEQVATVGVMFNPRGGCEACEDGRVGEGGLHCWACRLRRLQNIQDIQPWNRD